MFRLGDPGGRMYTNVGASNVNIGALWAVSWSNNAFSPVVLAGNGRLTGSCLRWSNPGNTSGWLSRTFEAQNTWGVAFALRWSTFLNSTSIVVSFIESAGTQCDLRLGPTGDLTVTRNGTVLGTVVGAVNLNIWVHIEFKVKVDPSVGTVYVGINGAQRLNLSAQNTRNTANSMATSVVIGVGYFQNGLNGTGTFDFDDIIVYDGQTIDANSFSDITGPIGDCALAWLLPTGDGFTTQFTRDSGTNNYLRVNEATPDGDTSYVESLTPGQIDTYAMADLPGTVTSVKSLMAVSLARKTDTGYRGMKSELRSGGGNTFHATEMALGTNYVYNLQNWGRDPNNGSVTDWTPTSVNALESGQTIST